MLDTLTEREQKVLRLRFGMNDGRARTLEEVGKKNLMLSIRQIEAKEVYGETQRTGSTGKEKEKYTGDPGDQ